MEFLHALEGTVAGAADMVLAAAASTRHAGLQMLDGHACDVLVVDLGLPDGSGIDVIGAAATHWPRCAVMVSTNFGDELHVMRAIEAGAAGYLLKHTKPGGLADEIRSIFHGGSPISPIIARQMLTRFRHLPPARQTPARNAAAADEQALRPVVAARAAGAGADHQGLHHRGNRRLDGRLEPHRADLHPAHLPQAEGELARRGDLRGKNARLARLRRARRLVTKNYAA